MRKETVYLRHILDAVDKIEKYVEIGYDDFMAHSHWQDAVIRQLEIVGEATKRISEDLRERYPEVPWRLISGLISLFPGLLSQKIRRLSGDRTGINFMVER